jgi:hypothetical protein
MKKKVSLSFIIFIQFILINSFAQDIEKKYHDSEYNLEQDVIIKRSVIKKNNNKIFKIFEIESPYNGNYYLNVWTMGGELDSIGSGRYVEYDLIVNNGKKKDKLKPLKNNWHNITYIEKTSKKEKQIKLKKGINRIEFSCEAPEIPEIEFIRLSKNIKKSRISSRNYDDFIKSIKKSVIITKKSNKNIAINNSVSNQKNLYLPNPEGDYMHHIEIDYNYTWYKLLWINAGEQISTRVWSDEPVVIEIFSNQNPELYSWSKYGADDDEAQYTVLSTPFSDYYYVRVRQAQSNQYYPITGRIKVNGVNYQNCPISSTRCFRYTQNYSLKNYFTWNYSRDTRIFIEEDNGNAGRIIAHNDDYEGNGTIDWNLASRVKTNYVNVGWISLQSYGSYNPTGTCDLYIGCKSYSSNRFPYLHEEDAMQSGHSNSNYNCIAWSAGITDEWCWPPTEWGQSWWDPDDLICFDNFYNFNHYSGCDTYSRLDKVAEGTEDDIVPEIQNESSVPSNAVLALWYNPNENGWDVDSHGYKVYKEGMYTHACVRNRANNNAHGYAWESKDASLERFFHPLFSISYQYWDVYHYYALNTKKSGNKYQGLTLKESIDLGLTNKENITLSYKEKSIIRKRICYIDSADINEFELRYQKWKTKRAYLSGHSGNPRYYTMNNEYNDFINFCIKLGLDSWALVFDKFLCGDYLIRNAIEDLTFSDYFHLMEDVREENRNQRYTKSGSTIYHTSKGYWTKYIQKVLINTNGLEYTISKINNSDISSSLNLIEIFPNPVSDEVNISFNITYASKITVSLCDLKGNIIALIENERIYSKGHYLLKYDVSNIKSGLHFISIKTRDKSITNKLLID